MLINKNTGTKTLVEPIKYQNCAMDAIVVGL